MWTSTTMTRINRVIETWRNRSTKANCYLYIRGAEKKWARYVIVWNNFVQCTHILAFIYCTTSYRVQVLLLSSFFWKCVRKKLCLPVHKRVTEMKRKLYFVTGKVIEIKNWGKFIIILLKHWAFNDVWESTNEKKKNSIRNIQNVLLNIDPSWKLNIIRVFETILK